MCLQRRCCESFFDILDIFSENKKSRVTVWPLQILLLILSPVRINRRSV